MTLPSAGRFLGGSFILLQAVDFCFTQQLLEGVRPDVYEANPLATRILLAHGWSGLALFKLLCTLVGLAAVALLWRRRASTARRVLLSMCLVMASVVVYSGTLLARPADSALADLPRLDKESCHMDHHFDVLREFNQTKTQLCEDLLAGRRDLQASLAGMRQCLEKYAPHLWPPHRATLPDTRHKELVLAYLYHKVSSLVAFQPGSKEKLRRLRQSILERYPDASLIDFGSREQLPWLARAEW
jgi:hypothetical protein